MGLHFAIKLQARGKTAVTNRSKASANHRAHADHKSLNDYHICLSNAGKTGLWHG
jgi:hypothetical protein